MIAGGIVFAVILFMVLGTDQNGGKIFLPADVNLLFSSPLKPQSVLMFRLTTRLGISVLGSVYMLFQIPNLMNAGLSLWSALAIVPAWGFTLVLATLIQMLIYTVSATYPNVKRFVRSGIYVLLGLIAKSVIPVALTLAGLSFFRSLGNPLAQDTNTDYFLLIPESNWAKLFWSLMGGTANCFLDMLIPLLIGAFVAGANPLTALLWIPFIVSVDFYATNVGAFINLSVPVSAGKTLKQIVQIMFIYFGLLPDLIVMAIGLSFGFTAVAVVVSSILNMGLGFLFFGLTPLFLGRR